MKTTTPPKSKAIIVTVKLGKVGTGHRPHMSGAGTHKHKCDRRQGNRSQRTARLVGEY